MAKKASKTTAKKATKHTAKKAVKRVAKKTDTAETTVAEAEQADLFELGASQPESMPTESVNQDVPASPEVPSQDVAHASALETAGQKASAHPSPKTHAPRSGNERSNRPNKFNKNKRNKRGPNGQLSQINVLGLRKLLLRIMRRWPRKSLMLRRIVCPS